VLSAREAYPNGVNGLIVIRGYPLHQVYLCRHRPLPFSECRFGARHSHTFLANVMQPPANASTRLEKLTGMSPLLRCLLFF
jgi:hypothetical protein